MTISSLKLAVCLTFLFFAKITFSNDLSHICQELASLEEISFSTVYQCTEVTEELNSSKKAKDPVICSFIDSDGGIIGLYDLGNNFYSSNYQSFSEQGYFAAQFIDEHRVSLKTRSATVEIEKRTPQSAEITYTLFKNGWTTSSTIVEAVLGCEIISL